MQDYTEKMLESREIYRGRIIRVRRDKVLQSSGRKSTREVVEHPGGVGILAFDDENRVALVRQYRYAMGEHLWEIPAGKREPGEEPFLTAQRELQEEVGATAEKWTPLGEMIASPGCYNEILHLYMAEGLTFVGQHLDEGEYLDAVFVPFEEAVERCLRGELRDGKTIAALLKAKLLRAAGENA